MSVESSQSSQQPARRRLDESLFQTRVRKINDDLWPSFSDRLWTSSPAIPRKKPIRKPPVGTGSTEPTGSHAAPTASSLHKMDEFVRMLFQHPVKMTKKMEQSSMRPVLQHMARIERAVHQLQEDYSSQVMLERESQKTFAFMKSQIGSLKQAFGILSEVLIDEVEDIRTVVSEHTKSVASIRDESRFRGRLSEEDDGVREQISRTRSEMESKVAIIHSNMLQLQGLIEDNQSSIHQDIDELRTQTASQLRSIQEDPHPVIGQLAEHVEDSLNKINADFEAYQEAHSNSLGQIFGELSRCLTRCDELSKKSAARDASQGPIPGVEDFEALEANVDTLAITIKELVMASSRDEDERERTVAEARMGARQDMKILSEKFIKDTESLRLDLDQIEESVIAGFDSLSKTLSVENPLKIYDKDAPDTNGDGKESSAGHRLSQSSIYTEHRIEPFD